MNAPWKPTASTRDPFCAYLCDDVTLDTVRPVAIDLGWQPEKVCKGGLRDAVLALSVSASPTLLLVDLSESCDPLHEIRSLSEVCEPGTIVIAIGQVNDVRLYRDLLASGIHDYLLKPLSPGQLLDAIAQAQAANSAPLHANPAKAANHCSIAVIGTRGGAGASTVATSLAWLFSSDQKRSTALLDFDIHFGTGALTLDLEPGRGLIDAIETPGRIDGLFIERATIRANNHLVILSAEAPIGRPLLSDGSAFARLSDEFRNAFEITVIDMPRGIMINYPQMVTNINVVVLVTELTLAAARDTIRLLAWLRTQAPQAEVVIVANKVPLIPTEIGKADFSASIEAPIAHMVRLDTKASITAAKLGRTFIEANADSKVAADLREVAATVLVASGSKAPAIEPPTPGAARGGFDFKALITSALRAVKVPAGSAE